MMTLMPRKTGGKSLQNVWIQIQRGDEDAEGEMQQNLLRLVRSTPMSQR
jgi:hypothetical protein